jgi:hypothetical protein
MQAYSNCSIILSAETLFPQDFKGAKAAASPKTQIWEQAGDLQIHPNGYRYIKMQASSNHSIILSAETLSPPDFPKISRVPRLPQDSDLAASFPTATTTTTSTRATVAI